MKIDLPQGLLSLAEKVSERGQRLYCVGGAVRNALLSLPYNDIDICSGIMPEDMMELCRELELSCVEVNRKLGTLHIDIDGETIEYTTFRRESYPQGGGHDPLSVDIGVTMREDALRRDFSVNALYYDILSHNVEDPTGKGLSDLKKGRLSTTTQDPSIIMKDDALRMMRLCRFAAELNFKIDPEVVRFVRKNSAMLHDISKERIFAEMNRLLLADTKYPMLSGRHPAHKRGLLALHACGLFTEIFPEYKGADTFGKCRYHRHSLLFHVINTCSLMPPTLEHRYGGLLHDIGKCKCYFENGNMHGHDTVGEELARIKLSELKAPKKLTSHVCDIVRWHMYDLTGMAKESTIRRQIIRMGKDSFKNLIIIRRADVYGSGMTPLDAPVETADRFEAILRRMTEEGAPFTLSDLAINGRDIIDNGIASGSDIGDILEKLLIKAALRPRLNTKDKLLAEAAHEKKILDNCRR